MIFYNTENNEETVVDEKAEVKIYPNSKFRNGFFKISNFVKKR